jgi:predicted nucleic acid-binding protein
MADQITLLDTSILIDYFRKKDKSKTAFVRLADDYTQFFMSAITEYEIRSGINPDQESFWEQILGQIEVIPFDSKTVSVATAINRDLKKKSKQIAIPDLFIAATAVAAKVPLATLNRKHFDRIDDLTLADL